MYCHIDDNSFSQSPFDTFIKFSTSMTAAATTTDDLDFSHQHTHMEIEASNLASNGNYYCYNGNGSRDSSYISSPSNSLASHSNCPATTITNHVMMERSMSSHSLRKAGTYSPLGSHDESSNDGSVGRVFSTGDWEGVNSYMLRRKQRAESPLSISSENSMIIEGMTRATRYSPEERKERIERYRSKRNQRNFNKKIQYACRKTLADSRSRIKGRFARNEEILSSTSTTMTMMMEKSVYDQWSAHDDDEEEVGSWANLLEYSCPSHSGED